MKTRIRSSVRFSRWLPGAAVVVLLAGLALAFACSGEETTTTTQAVTTTQAATTPSAAVTTDIGNAVLSDDELAEMAADPKFYTPKKWGERAEIRDLYATVQEPFADEQAPSRVEGRKVMIAEVTLRNQSGDAEDGNYDKLQFTAFDEQGRRYSCTAMTSRQPLAAGNLRPGETVTGFLAYDLPNDATVERIVWHKDVFEWINMWAWQ